MFATTRLAAVIFLWACSTSQTDEPYTEADSVLNAYDDGFDAHTFGSYQRLDNYLMATKIPLEDIQTIDSTSAIMVNPSTEQLSEMAEDYGVDDLATITDDQGYFQSMARHLLDSASILVVEAEKRYIRLTGENDKIWVLDVRKEGAPAWNLILFNTRKEPEIIPSTDLTTNKISQYFSRD